MCRSVVSPVKHGAFIRPLQPQQAEDWVPHDALKSRSAAIMSRKIIPGISIHTCPLIFSSQREFVRGSLHLHSLVLFICNKRGEGKTPKKEQVSAGCQFDHFYGSDFQGSQNLRS